MNQPSTGMNLEDKAQLLRDLMARAPSAKVADYREKLLMSWVYHDSAMEGVVYTSNELFAAFSNQPVTDSSLIPVIDEIRQHKAAIEAIYELAEKPRLALNLEVITKIYSLLAPEECEGKGPPKYRKDMPLHRLYFHEISQPDKIAAKMRQLIDWMNSSETKRAMHPTRMAARAHHQLLQVYPFPKHSGKVARLLMNLILIRHQYPPVIIHATERQRYYDALKGTPNAVSSIVHESLMNSIDSTIRHFQGEPAAARAS